MIEISHHYETEADWRAHYTGVRVRLGGSMPRMPVVFLPTLERAPFKRDVLSIASAGFETASVDGIKADIARRHGVSVAEIVGRRRTAKIVAARREAILAVYHARPMWSDEQIGRAFRRDRTTITDYLKKAGLR